MMNWNLLTIRGAPGVGKSSLAEALRRKLTKGAIIEVDRIREMHNQVNWWHPGLHRRSLRAAGDLAFCFVEQGACPVLVVDTFGGGKLWAFLKHLRGKSPGLRVLPIALHCSEAELRKRLQARADWQCNDWYVCRLLNEQIPRTGVSGELLLDVSDRTPEEVTAEILHHMESKDWADTFNGA
ncbi:MAG: hypothetical protein C4524_09785 [Candidatus Zixiibacteriota bacterium]|nr:MAG: hypothetical protein C4524_09785 [candidate division Zixibacteria bacterium]